MTAPIEETPARRKVLEALPEDGTPVLLEEVIARTGLHERQALGVLQALHAQGVVWCGPQIVWPSGAGGRRGWAIRWPVFGYVRGIAGAV